MHKQKGTGFTIVELLIVVVVIAILAAISVVAYTGIQNRAYDSAVQADLHTLGKQFANFQTDKGRLPASSADYSSIGMTVARSSYGNHYLSLHNMAYCLDATAGTFALVAASKTGNIFVFKDANVKQGVGPLQTHATTCSANNGQPTPNSTTWFYSNGSWQSYIGG